MLSAMSGSPLATVGLAARSLLWTVLLPGFFAGYVPWRWFGLGAVRFEPGSLAHWAGALLIGTGIVLLAACIWEFAHRGRGTLSPLDPPRRLVVEGAYRHVRNPMYLAVTLIVLGEVLLGADRGLLWFWLAWFAAANAFVLGYEEPALRRQFGASYEHYAREVGRWVPRLRPYRSTADL